MHGVVAVVVLSCVRAEHPDGYVLSVEVCNVVAACIIDLYLYCHIGPASPEQALPGRVKQVVCKRAVYVYSEVSALLFVVVDVTCLGIKCSWAGHV